MLLHVFSYAYSLSPKKNTAIKMRPAMILPELNGKPIVLTKNNSKALKYFSVNGNKNLKTNSNTAMDCNIGNDKIFGC